MIQKTKLKVLVNAEDLNMSSDVYERVEHKVRLMILDACERAKGNGRKTLQAKDI